MTNDEWISRAISMPLFGWNELRSAQNLRAAEGLFEQELRGLIS